MKPLQLIQAQERSLRRDAQIILAHLVGTKPQDLVLIDEVDPETVVLFNRLIRRRKEGVPVPYLIGEWDFMEYTFKVREGVLIPRPETEILVEKTLELIPQDRPLRGFEVGGGTGCISISLLLKRPFLKMYISDVNLTAVELMKENSKLHGVEDRMEIRLGDLFEPVKGMAFDFVISNPPYIPLSKWSELPREVRREGYVSLIGGRKGYEIYERMAGEVKKHLKPGGFIALEIGHDQGKAVKSIFEEVGFKIEVYKDYSGHDRVVVGWNC